MNYQVDGELIAPQPTSHDWEPDLLGHDGDGAPVKRKYRVCVLSIDHKLASIDWSRYDDGQAHSVTLPAPQTTDRWTTYEGCYIESVTPGPVVQNVGFEGVQMRVIHIEVQ